MPSQKEIDDQQKVLNTHRGTLSILLGQRAQFTGPYTPPSIEHGILEARANIRRVKKILRDWDVSIPDHPDDEEDASIPSQPQKPGPTWTWPFPRDLTWWASVATIAALFIALGQWLWPNPSSEPTTPAPSPQSAATSTESISVRPAETATSASTTDGLAEAVLPTPTISTSPSTTLVPTPACVKDPILLVGTGHSDEVTAVIFSRDDQTLASASQDGTIILWQKQSQTTNLKLIDKIKGHEGRVSALTFSFDGQTLASASWDGIVKLWDISKNKLSNLIIFPNTKSVTSIAFNPKDSNILAVALNNGSIHFWDTSTKKERGLFSSAHSGAVNSLAYSPDGTRLASAGDDGIVRIWNVEENKEATIPLKTFIVVDPKRVQDPGMKKVSSVAFDRDGKTVASASFDGMVKLWDVESSRQLPVLTEHKGPVNSVNFSPDGKILTSASSDEEVRLWRVSDGHLLARLCQAETYKAAYSVAFAPDGMNLASAWQAHTVLIWEVKEWVASK